MLEFYPQIKWVHVAAVICSGLLFALRGTAQLAGARWTMAAPLRYLSYAIDTTLLTAALMLATLLHQYPFVHAWLTVKVLLLVVYVVLGSFAPGFSALIAGSSQVVIWAWKILAMVSAERLILLTPGTLYDTVIGATTVGK